MDKNQSPKISIAGYENSCMVLGHPRKLGVVCFRQPELAHANNVMPKTCQHGTRTAVDILIDEELHEVAT